MKQKIAAWMGGVGLVVLCAVGQVEAAPVLGGQMFVQGTGDVVAEFLGSAAAYNNILFLQLPAYVYNIFHNHVTPVGTQYNLGSFPVGTELVFGIHVLNTNYAYFSGPGVGNPDGIPHAIVDDMYAPNTTWVGFEDLYAGGDKDYDDVMFAFHNVGSHVPVPEPSTLLLLASGFGGLLLRRRLV